MPTNAKPRLPAANEFTPGQLGGGNSLFEALQIVDQGGSRDEIVESIRQRWFTASAATRQLKAEQLEQQRKRAGNVVAGMRQYGLLGSSVTVPELSELGVELLASIGDRDGAYRRFARYLLRERHGIELLRVAQDLKARDGSVSKGSVDAELLARGYAVPTNSSNSGKLRQWLEQAHLVDAKWNVDVALLSELAGIDQADLTSWRSLTLEQQDVVIALRIRAEGNRTPIPSPELLELLRQRGVNFNSGQVKKTIYDPLVRGGWIEQTLLKGGRGGKGGLIAILPKGLDIDLELVEGLSLGQLPPELQSELSLPLGKILTDLDSGSTYDKGIALELLSLRLATDSGLLPVELRQRGVTTGGAEVDLVAEGAHLHFSRWLFQCKNQSSNVGLAVLAKELGMATLLRAQVVVIVTTGRFARTVLEYAKQASETTAIQVVLLDRDSLAAYREHGAPALRSELHQRALTALRNKRTQLREVPDENDESDLLETSSSRP